MNQDFNNSTPPQSRYITYIPYGFTPETYEERINLRKISNIIGGSLLIMLGVSAVLPFLLRIIFGILGISGTKMVNLLSEAAFLQYLQAILSAFVFTLPFVFLFKVSGFSISGLIKFKKPKKRDILPYSLLGISFCAFANITVSLMGSFFSSFGVNYEVDYIKNPGGFFGFMLTFIATAIVPPLTEEFACRGLILGSLRKYGNGFAVICSAILFGIMHGNFQQMPFAFLVGLGLGYITVKCNTIWIAVFVHAFNNAVSVVFGYIFTDSGSMLQNMIYAIYLVVCLVLGIVAVYLLRNNDKAYKLKKVKSPSTAKQKFKWFFTTPTVIIFIILSLLQAMTFFN